MGDEADVLARLSRVLETQSLGFGSVDDNSSTAEMLSKLNNEIGDVSIAESKNDGYNRSMMMSKVQMPNRKTPYEVWAETQQTEVVKVSPPAHQYQRRTDHCRISGRSRRTLNSVRAAIIIHCDQYSLTRTPPPPRTPLPI